MPLSSPLPSRAPPPGRPSLQERRDRARRLKLVSAAVLVGGLAVIAAVGLMFAPRLDTAASSVSDEPPPPKRAAAPASAASSGLGANPAAAAPLELLGRAKEQAIAWHPDAVLVAIEASPVIGGNVDLSSGGRIDFVYGQPTGQGFGPGARIKPDALRVRARPDALTSEPTRSATLRAASAPNCALKEAVQELMAAGVGAETALDIRFEYSPKHDRTVWAARTSGEAGEPRFVDGWSCNILVR